MLNDATGTLYVIATPIGNLEDMTMRAIRILKEVDFVFAEDTRTTGILFKKYEIQTKLISYNAHNHKEKNLEIIKLLEEGKSIGLVSDAGTPGISDPGYSAVAEVRKALPEAKIVTIPGASALTAFVSILGYGTHAWTFYGFLPHKNGRQTLLKEILASEYSSIFYESTHRIEKCMQELVKLGSTRKVVIGKELTKIYEEIIVGTPEEILEIFAKNPQKKKGEFVVMVV
jgi:16S rRNA (cytidine1402-2'-O)-methyltransferase